LFEELKQILEGLLALNASDAWEDLEEVWDMGIWPAEKEKMKCEMMDN